MELDLRKPAVSEEPLSLTTSTATAANQLRNMDQAKLEQQRSLAFSISNLLCQEQLREHLLGKVAQKSELADPVKDEKDGHLKTEKMLKSEIKRDEGVMESDKESSIGEDEDVKGAVGYLDSNCY